MAIFSCLLGFGLGVGASCVIIPEVSKAVTQIREDTEAILHSRRAIDQLCVDKIARWYYDGTLELALSNIVRQAEENRIKVAQLQNGLYGTNDFKTNLSNSLIREENVM
jgi:hypothetical protein